MSVIQRPTLVLNRNWQAVNVTPVSRALSMVFSGTARVVEPQTYEQYDWNDWAAKQPVDGEAFVQAVAMRLRVPEVVTLTGYDRLPEATVTFSRRNIFKRDRFVCQYCGTQPRREDLTLDHVVPRAQGGQSTWENCVLACLDCNSRKAARTPTEAGMRLRRAPVRPNWRPMFAAANVRIASWSHFVSQAYWDADLQA